MKGDIEREKADGGLFITLENPTKPMIEEAISAGTYSVKFTPAEFPKVQILTIENLLMKRQQPKLPILALNYYKEAKAIETKDKTQKLSL